MPVLTVANGTWRWQDYIRLRPSVLVGLTLLVLYVVQDVYALKPSWLVEQQQKQIYRQITGLLLLSYLFAQWALARTRLAGNQASRRELDLHRWLGALAPLVFYIHSADPGYSYQYVLSAVYLGNCLLGSFNREVVKIARPSFWSGWLAVHIGLAVSFSILALFHIYIVFSYW
jgi:hypothetical protein